MNDFLVEAKIENVGDVIDYVCTHLEDCSEKTKNQIGVAVDEIFMNIANYAYNPEVGMVVLRVHVEHDDVTIEFEDGGIEYNPVEHEAPDTAIPIEEREIGGLGMHIVKNIMDTVEYRREEHKNILTLKKSVIE